MNVSPSMVALIVTTLVAIVTLVAVVESSPTRCRNPSDYDLENKLLDFQRMVDKLEQQHLARKYSAKKTPSRRSGGGSSFVDEWQSYRRSIRSPDSTTSSDSLLVTPSAQIDDSMCDMSKRNRTEFGTLSVCPFEYTVVHRPNLYPRLKSMVKCGCTACRSHDGETIGEGRMACEPVYRYEPALRRADECSPDGYYNWETVFEHVPIACTCQHLFKLLAV